MQKNGELVEKKIELGIHSDTGPMYHFADSIVKDEPHNADCSEGLIVMQILDALYKSAEKGRPVRIN